jgi:hypothetical protein
MEIAHTILSFVDVTFGSLRIARPPVTTHAIDFFLILTLTLILSLVSHSTFHLAVHTSSTSKHSGEKSDGASFTMVNATGPLWCVLLITTQRGSHSPPTDPGRRYPLQNYFMMWVRPRPPRDWDIISRLSSVTRTVPYSIQ